MMHIMPKCLRRMVMVMLTTCPAIIRTMVWAIDLDDGTLIEALGSNLNRQKAAVYNDTIYMCNLGTGLDVEEEVVALK